MPKSRSNRRNSFRVLFLERLQDRQLMAADLLDPMAYDNLMFNFDSRNLASGRLASSDYVVSAPVLTSPNYNNAQTIGVDESDNAAFSNDGYAFVFRDQLIRIIDISVSSRQRTIGAISKPTDCVTSVANDGFIANL